MNTAWQAIKNAAAAPAEAFRRAMEEPAAAQQAQLEKIISANARTEFGRAHGFEVISDSDDYQNQVPIQRYEDLAPYIGAMADGVQRVLTDEPVVLFEETGGSAGGAKLIPYTAAALSSFRNALLPWLSDSLNARPRLTAGRAYWAISPVVRKKRMTGCGISVGTESDAIYLGTDIADDFTALSVVGTEVRNAEDYSDWRYLTALSLLRAGDLSLISVWSPTFLFPILDAIQEHADQILADIADGRVRHPGTRDPLPGDGAEMANAERARLLERLLGAGALPTDEIWPQLDMISCWTHGSARPFSDMLIERFPQVRFQGKGLLATEGVITFPLDRYPYPVLALNSGYYEFLDDTGASHLCGDIDEGGLYRVVMTTHGGLYRYDISDRVCMRGWATPGLPMLEFIGRTGPASDLCGEKLSADFVETCLRDVAGFRMLAPDRGARPPRYVLVMGDDTSTVADTRLIEQRVEHRLQENPQYRYARNLGQLEEVEVRYAHRPLKSYLDASMERGQRLGDIKPASLWPDSDILERFQFHDPDSGGAACGSF